MSLFIKRLTALLMAAILALNLVGINTFAEESDSEDTVNATPFEIDDEFSVSEEGNSTEDNITDKIEENDGPIDSDSDVIVDKLLITGFADLDVAFFSVEEKLPVEELGLPEQLPVYINNSEEVVYIDVIWTCDDDYENTEYEMYTFSPIWDEGSYELAMDVDTAAVPFIEVSIQNIMNSDNRDGNVVTPTEDDFIFNNGAIEGLSTTYLATLTTEQRLNIKLVIPKEINGITVTAIGDKAFSRWNNTKYEGCNFIGLDLSQASSLMIIGNDAFYNAKGITDDLIIPDTVTTIGNNAFRECTGLNGELKLSDSLVSIGQYAFNNCKFSGLLKLPSKLESIGNSAFRIDKNKSFTGELIIPASVKSIDKVAFSGQQGITSVKFEGSNITELPDSVFRYCSGLSGVLRIPESIQKIGANTFAETSITTMYLPKLKDVENKSFILSNTFGTKSTSKIKAIVCNKEDYTLITSMIGSSFSPVVGYEMIINFETSGFISFDPITRLYNHAYNMEKNSDGEWLVTNYTLPKVEGKKWGLASSDITPVLENNLVSQDILYLINAYEDPIITYSQNIDKVYDGLPVQLIVNAEHPLAKDVNEATNGDVIFYYWWSWDTITPKEYVLQGFGKNKFEFSDVHAPYKISCTVTVGAYVVYNNTQTKRFYYTSYRFYVDLRQAPSIVNPIYSNEQRTIGSGLPDINLSAGDTEGTIKWDEGQTITEGVNDYTWTFTPVENSVGSSNYTTVQGKASLNFVQGYNVIKGNITNGDIELDKPYGAIPNDDLTITFKPNSGYKLSSASLDNTDIYGQVLDNKYTIRNIKSNHTLDASFTSMETKDVENVIDSLPDIRDDVISEEVKNDILDAKLHYDAVTKDSEDISEDAKEKMYEAISKLDQVETAITPKANVTNNIDISNEVSLLENMQTEDAEALKNSNNASLKIELVVDNAKIEGDKQQVLESVLGDAVVGDSFDVTVIKKLTDNNVTKETPLKELKKPIQLVFEIPSNLPVIEPGYVREFSIIRLHEVDGQIIPEVLKDEDSYEDSISVSSDKFSTYIIVYKDVKKQDSSQGGGSGSYSKTYTVKFETLGGTHVDAITDIKQGKKLTQPANPRRKGYTFTGWFADEKCTKPFDFTKDTIKANMTLYARWEKIEEMPIYDVSFNTSGGTNISKQFIEEGQKVLLPAAPSKEGYIFTGWYLDEACTLPLNFDMYTVHANTVIYAGWQKNDESTNQTVVNEPNNTTNEPESDEPTHGESFESEEGIHKVELRDTLDPSTTWIMEVDDGELFDLKDMPEKEGYVFKGYFIDEKCTIPFNKDEPIQKDLNLYAGWDKVEESKNDGNKAEDDKDQHKEEQDTNKAEEVPVKDTASSTLYIIILVIVLVLGGIFILLKKKKK